VLKVDDLAASGGVDGWLRHRPFVIGAGHAFTRRMMRSFGPLDPAIHHEDQIMVFRALATGGAVTVDAALVRYRRGGASATPSAALSRRRGLAPPPPAPGDRRARDSWSVTRLSPVAPMRWRRVRAACAFAGPTCRGCTTRTRRWNGLQALFMAGRPRAGVALQEVAAGEHGGLRLRAGAAEAAPTPAPV
jgi:hypothetical protein